MTNPEAPKPIQERELLRRSVHSELGSLKAELNDTQKKTAGRQVEEMTKALEKNGGTSREELREAQGAAKVLLKETQKNPAAASDFADRIERFSESVQNAADKIANLGSKMLKMLASFLGADKEDSFLGRILLNLAESNTAQFAHIRKAIEQKLGNKERALAITAKFSKDAVASLLDGLRTNLKSVQEAEAGKGRKPTSFEDFADTVIKSMKTDGQWSVEEITKKGTEVATARLGEVAKMPQPATTPAAPASTPAPAPAASPAPAPAPAAPTAPAGTPPSTPPTTPAAPATQNPPAAK